MVLLRRIIAILEADAQLRRAFDRAEGVVVAGLWQPARARANAGPRAHRASAHPAPAHPRPAPARHLGLRHKRLVMSERRFDPGRGKARLTGLDGARDDRGHDASR